MGPKSILLAVMLRCRRSTILSTVGFPQLFLCLRSAAFSPLDAAPHPSTCWLFLLTSQVLIACLLPRKEQLNSELPAAITTIARLNFVPVRSPLSTDAKH